MRTLGFHHVALQVGSLERMAAFYTQVLGLRELVRHRREDGTLRSIWLAVGPSPASSEGFLALEHCAGGAPKGELGYSLTALRIEAQERERVRLRLGALGVTIEHETRWTMYLRDPEGNRVALSHHPDEA